MTGRRAAFGVAVKNARRNKKRTFYLVALIGLPVMVAVMTSAFMRASHVSQAEYAGLEYGSANVKIESWGVTPGVADWISKTITDIDPNASTLEYRQDYRTFGPDMVGRVIDLDLEDPLAQGILTLTDGTTPAAAGEVVLSEHLAAALGVSTGDEATLTLRRGEEAEYEVVGLASHPIFWNLDEVVVSPEEMENINQNQAVGSLLLIAAADDPAFSLEFSRLWEQARYQFYPDNVTWPMPEDLNFLPEEYYAVMTPEELEETRRLLEIEGIDSASNYAYALFGSGVGQALPNMYAESLTDRMAWSTTSVAESPPVIGTAVAAVILAEVAFIAGAAFATGTRRRLREIGLLGANGASTSHVKTSVVSEGFLAGLGGGLLGSSLAVALLILGRPVLQRFVDRRIEEFPLSAFDLAGPVIVAVIACVIAAWLPAKTASLVPTLTALQGRMPVGAPKRWVIPAGLVITAFGTLLLGVGLATASDSGSAVAVIGAVLMIGGMALLAGPIVAWVSKHAERFPITTRIVLRDSGRQRGRAAAAVAATMVILMAPVAALAAVGSNEASSGIYGLQGENPQLLVEGSYDETYETVPLTTADVDAVRKLLPAARSAMFQVLIAQVEYPAELAARKTGNNQDEGGYYISETRTAIANDELLAFLDDKRLEAALARDGRVLLGVEERSTTVAVEGEELVVEEVPVAVQQWSFPRLLLTEEAAASMNTETRDYAVFEVDGSSWGALSDPFGEVWGADLNLAFSGSGSDLAPEAILILAFVATMLIVLIVVATITSLSAAEADSDLRTVVAVGATNSIRRRYLGLQSGLHTVIGALLAVPLTLLLYKTVVVAGGSYRSVGNFGVWDSSTLHVPWGGIAMLVIGLPIAIGLITAATVRSAPTTPPRRAT